MTPLERATDAVEKYLGVNDEITASPNEIARAVLQAFREPSEAMVEAGARVDGWVQGEGQAPQPEVWQAMLDAGLAE